MATFQTTIAQYALDRGLSRASVMYVLASVRAPHVAAIKPEDRATVYRRLEDVPSDVAKTYAARHLCYCEGYPSNVDECRERHKKRCRYVLWRRLIDEPLESIFDEESA